MSKFTHFIGLDLGKSSIHVAVLNQDNELVFQDEYANDWESIEALSSRLIELNGTAQGLLVALESCGVYGEKVLASFCEKSIFTWLWNPLLAKHAPLELNRHKDDPNDAKSMAHLAALYGSKAVAYVPKSTDLEDLRALFLLRKQLVKQRVQTLNQRAANLEKAKPNERATHTHDQHLLFLSSEIKQLNQEIRAMIKAKPAWNNMYEILISIPGIGPTIATQMIEITQGFTRFASERELAKFIGIFPLRYQSGTSVKRRTSSSPKAHKKLKIDMTMGAVSQIRKNMFFHDFYVYKIKQGKHHLYVINSMRNIILKLAFKLVKTGQKFDRDIYLKNKNSWNFT